MASFRLHTASGAGDAVVESLRAFEIFSPGLLGDDPRERRTAVYHLSFASTLSHRQAAVVASSESFADALTMAATAWRTRSALLLADPGCPHGRADGRILSHIDTLQSGVVTLIGGEAALPSCVVDGL